MSYQLPDGPAVRQQLTTIPDGLGTPVGAVYGDE
jgi:hypothetical protein